MVISAIQWLSAQSPQKIPSHNTPNGISILPENNSLFVWQDFGFKKVPINTISYLKASRSYCEIHLTTASIMVVSTPMSEVGKHLIHGNFIRIHRSFIINCYHVEAIVGNTLVMEDKSKLLVSKDYRPVVLRCFKLIGSKSRKYTC